MAVERMHASERAGHDFDTSWILVRDAVLREPVSVSIPCYAGYLQGIRAIFDLGRIIQERSVALLRLYFGKFPKIRTGFKIGAFREDEWHRGSLGAMSTARTGLRNVSIMTFEPPELSDELLTSVVASLGVDDPDRAARLAQRLRDFGHAYCYGRLIQGPLRSYAASRAATRKVALLSEQLIEALSNLDTDVEIALTITASERRTKAVNKTISFPSIDALRHLQDVASHVAERLPKRTGRPNDRVLELVVGAMMAVIERMTGRRASVTQKRGSDYSPRLNSPEAKAIAAICQAVDPKLKDTKLINVIADLGKRYQRKPMHEANFLPLVGTPVYGVRARLDD